MLCAAHSSYMASNDARNFKRDNLGQFAPDEHGIPKGTLVTDDDPLDGYEPGSIGADRVSRIVPKSGRDTVDIDVAYRNMQRQLDQYGIALPQSMDRLFASEDRLDEILMEHWGDDEPDVVPSDSIWSEPGSLTWKGANFSPPEARRWERSGVSEPSVARGMADHGMAPRDAATPYVYYDQYDYETVGHAVLFRELSIQEAQKFVAKQGDRASSPPR